MKTSKEQRTRLTQFAKLTLALGIGLLSYGLWGNQGLLTGPTLSVNLPTGNPKRVEIAFQTTSNLYYTLERVNDLNDLRGGRVLDVRKGDDDIVTIPYQPSEPKERAFFRVRVNDTPPSYFDDLQFIRDSRPIFRDGMPPSERTNVLERANAAMRLMGAETSLPPRIEQAVSLWESLTEEQKMLLLDKDFNPGIFETVLTVTAVVGAATAIAEVVLHAGDTFNWWGAAFVDLGKRPMTSDELDGWINGSLQPQGVSNFRVEDRNLNYR